MRLTKLLQHDLVIHSGVYLLTRTINSAIPFFFLPVLSRHISPADYGIIATIEILIPFFVFFVGLGTQSIVTVKYYKTNRDVFSDYLSNILIISAVSFLSILFLAFAFKAPVSQILKIPPEWIIFAVVAGAASFIFQLTLMIFRTEEKPIAFGALQILQSFLNIGLSLGLLLLLNWSWEGRTYGILFSYLAIAVACYVLIKRQFAINCKFDRTISNDILAFCLPLAPHILCGWIMTGIDRILITSLVGIAATGIYAAGYQVGAIVGFIASSFNQAWSPYLFKNLKDATAGRKLAIVKYTYLGFGLLLVLAWVVNWAAFYIFKYFLDARYLDAYDFVFWITLGGAFLGMYYLVANYIFYREKTVVISIVTSATALLNVILNIILIKSHGAIGAAWATTISYAFNFILVWTISMSIYPMPWFFFMNKKGTAA